MVCRICIHNVSRCDHYALSISSISIFNIQAANKTEKKPQIQKAQANIFHKKQVWRHDYVQSI